MKKGKSTWRENGERLRQAYKDAVSKGLAGEIPPDVLHAVHHLMDELPEAGPGNTWTIGLSNYEGLNLAFVEALEKSDEKNMSALAEYLKSDQPLGPKERERLARRLPKGTRIGRPHNRQVRAAASVARMFYKRLRELNKARGVKDHGHCDDMKRFAARVTVEDWFCYVPGIGKLSEEEIESFANRVREVMDKASSYVEAGEPGIVSFPLHWIKVTQNS
jgi:hypothetical protein